LEILKLSLCPEDINKRIDEKVGKGNRVLTNALQESIEDVFKCQFTDFVEDNLKKEITIKTSPFDEQFCADTLFDFRVNGYNKYYITIQIPCKTIDDRIKRILINTEGFDLEWPFYGPNNLKIREKKLKTQTNYQLELFNVILAPEFFEKITLQNDDFVMCDLKQEPQMYKDALVSFKHANSGKTTFCECSREYHDFLLNHAREQASSYAPGYWPDILHKVLHKPNYAKDICHLCITKKDDNKVALQRYSDQILKHQYPYIYQNLFYRNLDETTASADVKAVLGISRWKNESELYVQVKSIFPGVEIKREASPEWLGRQRIDIFLPKLKLAIEYQGEQHYKAIDVFGGQEALERTIERDELKLQKCKENNVEVVYFKHSEPLTKSHIKNKLVKYKLS